MEHFPRVGLGIFILKDGKLLLHKRKGKHGPGLWSGPGGHLEMGESFEDCVRRETREEAGIEVKNIQLLCFSNLKFPNGKHYIDVGFTAEVESGEPCIMEPEKNEGWTWFAFDEIPPAEELFGAEQFYIDTYKSGAIPGFRDM